jgi:hypothetical protein
MLLNDPAGLLEAAVNVAEGAEADQPAFVVSAGTSKSVLSQMKSFLL